MFHTFVFYDVFSPARFNILHSTQYLALIIQYVLAFVSLIMMFDYFYNITYCTVLPQLLIVKAYAYHCLL